MILIWNAALRLLVERVERLGGTFEIESSPGKGAYAVMSFLKTP